MRFAKTLFGVFIVCIASTQIAAAQETGIKFMTNRPWKEVCDSAKKHNKPIFVDCYTSWCGPCKLMVNKIFPQQKVGDFYNKNFINAKYDMETGEGLKFRKLYGKYVKNYPTMLYIDPNREELLHRIVGTKSVEELIQHGEMAKSDKGVTNMKKRYEAGNKDTAFLKEYITVLKSGSTNYKLIHEVIDIYFAQVGGYGVLLTDQNEWKFFSKYLNYADTKLFEYVLERRLSLCMKPYVDKQELNAVLQKSISIAISDLLNISGKKFIPNITRNDELRKMIGDMLEKYNDFPGRSDNVARINLYDCLIDKQWNKAYEIIEYMKYFDMPFTRNNLPLLAFNYIAEECDDKELLHKMIEYSNQVQADGEKHMDLFNANNFISNLYNKAGMKAEAKAAQKKYETINTQYNLKFNKTK